MSQSIQYSDNIGLVHLLSKKVFGRTSAMRIGVEYDDIFQELSIVFLKAAKKYNPNAGFSISAYFTKAAYRWADRIIAREKRYAIDIKAVSLDEMQDSDYQGARLSLDDGSTPLEMKAYVAEAFEEIYIHLSPVAKSAVDMTIKAPPILEREAVMAEVKIRRGLEVGARVRETARPSRLSLALSLCAKLKGLTQRQHNEAWDELKPLADYLG